MEAVDRGVQHERTALAWERTAFSGLVVGLLLMRRAAETHLLFGALGAASTLGAATMLVSGWRRYERSRLGVGPSAMTVGPTAMLAVGVGTTLTCGIGSLFVMLQMLEGP
jgi:uncharacterized membrane protein YidH (DUF202 family)